MKCTLCSQEMEEGIMDDGYWVQRTGMFKNAQNLGKKFAVVKMEPVIAYLCRSCNRIDLKLVENQ